MSCELSDLALVMGCFLGCTNRHPENDVAINTHSSLSDPAWENVRFESWTSELRFIHGF
jgi:hypothetical protein